MRYLKSIHVAINLAALASCVIPAEADDQTVQWSWGASKTKRRDGGRRRFNSILQCESLTFDWTNIDDDSPHDVYEFPDLESYAECDFSGAKKLAPRTSPGIYRLTGENTLETKTRWFASSAPLDCEQGKMKVTLRTRPSGVQTYEGFACSGGRVGAVMKNTTLSACEMCFRRGRCLGAQFDSSTEECTSYVEVPTGIYRKADMTCQLAKIAKTCPSPQEQYDAAKEKWADISAIAGKYKFDTSRKCKCENNVTALMTVEVEGNEKNSISYTSTGEEVPEDFAQGVLTIDEQFSKIGRALVNNANLVSVKYHEVYGSPTEILINYVDMIGGEELIISNDNIWISLGGGPGEGPD